MLHKDEAVHVFTALSSYGEEVSPYFQTVDLKAAIREAQDGVPSNMYDGFCQRVKAAGLLVTLRLSWVTEPLISAALARHMWALFPMTIG